jgi:hypothetical protein
MILNGIGYIPPKYRGVAKRVAEFERLRCRTPLALQVWVIDDQDVEVAKQRAAATHLQQHPQDRGREVRWIVRRFVTNVPRSAAFGQWGSGSTAEDTACEPPVRPAPQLSPPQPDPVQDEPRPVNVPRGESYA